MSDGNPESNGYRAITVRINALDRLLDERDRNTKDRFRQIEERAVADAARLAEQLKATAVNIAEQLRVTADALDKRLHNMNEVRESMQDQHEAFRTLINDILKTLLPRTEYDIHHQIIVDKQVAFERRIVKLEAHGDFATENKAQRLTLGLLISSVIAGFVAAVVGFFNILHWHN
jgi:hypothetical protein